jgi:ferrous iron transport protein A
MDIRPVQSEMVYAMNEVASRIGLGFQMQMAIATMMLQEVDFKQTRFVIRLKMQMAFKKQDRTKPGETARNLTDLKRGEHGVLDRIDLPEEEAQRLMEIGFLPGHTVTPAHSAPGGDPRVFRVDGTEVALRRETARKLLLRPSIK